MSFLVKRNNVMTRFAKSNTMMDFFRSWSKTSNVLNSTEDLLKWIEEKNRNVKVNINKIPYNYDGNWHYDREEKGIVNSNKSFFRIVGLKSTSPSCVVEQPIYIQPEIGFLGIIAKKIDGVLYLLMQAKIEPGNINKIQISPTIQATKSNFTQAHGGKSPLYLDYFVNADKYEVVVDQIQSEQSSRFLGKRNRNIVILVEEEIPVYESHKWMTLGQVKQLMQYDNLVNMDTRTVISCLPFATHHYSKEQKEEIFNLMKDKSLYYSLFPDDSTTNPNQIFRFFNDFKMLNNDEIEICDLYALNGWSMDNGEFSSKNAVFKVIFADIEIEGREVKRWQQPLFEATDQHVFGLMYRINNGKKEFLVKARNEVGCFDRIELGPSIQTNDISKYDDVVEEMFYNNISNDNFIEFDGLFSEEGGRFYHEQNRNVLMKVESFEAKLPNGYFWIDFKQLNSLIQYNNILNIQLRNLLSILNL